MEASSGMDMIVERYSIKICKIMGAKVFSIEDSKTGRFVTGANTRGVAEEKCRRLNAEDRRNER